MRLQSYMLNETSFMKYLGALKNMTFKKAKKFLKSEFDKFSEAVKNADMEDQVISLINKRMGTKYYGLDQISKGKVVESEEMVNEDAAHWWDLVKTEAFPTLSFYPGLTVWLELDKLLSGGDINVRKTVVYAIFWVLLISGKAFDLRYLRQLKKNSWLISIGR